MDCSYVAYALPITLSAISRHAKSAAGKVAPIVSGSGALRRIYFSRGAFRFLPAANPGHSAQESILFRRTRFFLVCACNAAAHSYI